MLKYQIKSIRLVFRYVPVQAALTLLVFVLSAIDLPLALYYIQRIIMVLSSALQENTPVTAAWWELALFVVLFVGAKLSLPTRNLCQVVIGNRLMNTLAERIMDKLSRLPYAAFEDPALHDTLNIMSEKPWEKLCEHFFATMGSLLYLSYIVGICVVIGGINPWLFLIVLVLMAPQVWLRSVAGKTYNSLYERQSGDERRLAYYNGLLTDKNSLHELKIFDAAGYILTLWRKKADDVLRERIRVALRAQLLFIANSALYLLTMAICFAVAGLSIYRGEGHPAQLAMMVNAFYKLSGYSRFFAMNYMAAARKTLELRHFDIFMGLPERPEGLGAGARERYSIEFRDVSFAYPGQEKNVLEGLSFRIEPGEKVAIVGENGAGKSTLIKLLCRLYPPRTGQILLDGRDIGDYTGGELSRMLGVVFQDYVNYSLTLRENVAFGNIGKLEDDEALHRALREGLAQELAQKLPGGLDTSLGRLEDDGKELSGGEWQRVAIARACCAGAGFTILDEPTASLDPLAESAMYESFSRVLLARGSIMISHRLGSARMADRILVLGDGRVTETGTHDELMERRGQYARMYNVQAAWYRQ